MRCKVQAASCKLQAASRKRRSNAGLLFLAACDLPLAAYRSHFLIKLTAFLLEPLGLFAHTFNYRHIHRVDLLVGGVLTHFLGNFHRAELRPAHGAEMRDLGRVLWQRFIVVGAGGVRVKPEVELVFPAKLEARFAQRIVANLCTRVPFRQVGRVGSDLVGDDPGFTSSLFGSPKCSLGVT
jgi:hypothetical protein